MQTKPLVGEKYLTALGAQWHPEWKFAADPLSSAIFRVSGDACRGRMRIRAHIGATDTSLANM